MWLDASTAYNKAVDYLDPQRQFRHRITLIVGYACITVLIIMATFVLVYQAYGFGLGKNGTVIQNGLLFVSSQPGGATIYLNNQPYKDTTNARLVLPANIYRLKLSRLGYRDWQRTVAVDGGRVEHFDYPFLIPQTLTSTKLGSSYSSAPSIATQSPDHRWLLIAQPSSLLNFDLYDLKNPTKAATTISLPTSLLNKGTTQSWQFVQWADDNQHVLLQHLYDGKSEFILLSRTDPAASLNLNTTLKITPDKLTLNNLKFDQYYSYTTAGGTLQSISLKNTTATTLASNVLAYQSYSNDGMLYITPTDAPNGKVLLKLTIGDQTYIVHTFPTSSTYVVDLTTYAGKLYVVAGASSENKVYIFKDPVGQLKSEADHAVVPLQVLHVVNPTFVSFSANAQFVMAESGQAFGVYDIENQTGYNFNTKVTLDIPQVHASWMDGDRLTYVSQGKVLIFDYDGTNQQMLVVANARYLPFFAPNFKFVYTLAPDGVAPTLTDLTQTSLLTKADQ